MKLAILTPLPYNKAETFVRNHIDELPFDIIEIYGGVFPYLSNSVKLSFYDKKKYLIKNFINKSIGIQTQNYNEFCLKKILSKAKVDAVFTEYLHVGAETVDLCKKMDIPMYAIGLGYEIYSYDLLKKYDQKYRKLFQYANGIFVVSNDMKTNIESFDCPKNKIIYTPAGAPEGFYKVTPEFNSKNILTVGRFVEKKAPHLVILSFLKVLLSVPDATLIMAGDGPLLPTCKDLVKGLGIQKSVVFTGRVNRERHQQLLKDAVVFVQHSKIAESGDSEGTPVAILEASAAGVPIVSTLHGGIPGVVKNEITGFLTQENDVDSMAGKIIHLLNNIEEAKKMGAAGREYVKYNFSLEKHINTISEHIKTS